MKEVKSPRKPLIYYYGIVLLVILVFNMVISPLLANARVKEVDYGTFMKMIEDKDIGSVEVADSEIVFTDKDNTQIYKTGEMNDPTLTERLYASGAKFTRNIEKGMSPLLSFFLTFILPILIFAALGQYMAKKMMSQAGGPNAMAFGMGKSMPRSTFRPRTASVLPMSLVRMKQRKILPKSSITYIIPRSIPMSAHLCPRAYCL